MQPPRVGHSGWFWALQLGGWTAYALALMIPWLGRYPLSVMWSNKLVIAGTGLATSAMLRLLYRRIARDGSPLVPPIATALVASVLGAFIWNGAASAILGRSLQNDSVLLGALGRTFPRFDGVLYHALVLLTWSLLYLGARHYRALVSERERSLRAESLAREARLAALRYQIGPHFLFNALNAISTLVVTDRKTDATSMIARLADLLRISLDSPERGMISLASELEIVRAYVAIERVRFGDWLRFSIDADDRALASEIPAMILQPLVENAVRHAVAVRDEATCVTITCHSERSEESRSSRPRAVHRDPEDSSPSALRAFARNDRVVLTVANDGSGASPTTEGLGVGIANVRARLAELYVDDYTFLAGPTPEGGFRAEISLPASDHAIMPVSAGVLEAQLA